MKTFTFTDPTGKRHSLNGPDDATPEQAFAILQQSLGAQGGAASMEDLTAAQRTVESNNNPRAVSKAGAMGVAQLMPATARELGVDPFNPQQAIAGQNKMMNRLIEKYNGSQILALQAYNWGEGNVDAFLKTGRGAKGQAMPEETRAYATKVLGKLQKPALGFMEPVAQGLQEAGGGINQLAARAMSKLGIISPEEAEASNIRQLAQASDYSQRRAAEGKSGIDIGRTAGNVLPNLMFPEAGVTKALGAIPHVAPALARIATGALQGAAGAGSQLARTPEEQLQNVEIGAAFGGALPAIGVAGRKIFGGQDLGPARQKLLETAQSLGIQPRPAAISNSGAARRLEQVLNATPGGAKAFGELADKNNEALSRGIGKLFGKATPELNDEALAGILRGIDDKYATALQGHALAPDKQLITDLQQLVKSTELKSDKAFLQQQIKDINLRSPMGAESYNKLRSRFGQKAINDAMHADIYNGIQDVIDDWATRRLPAGKGDILKKAREEYWLYKQIAPAVDPAVGTVTPSKLATTLRSRSNRAFMTGNVEDNPLVPFSRMAEFTKKQSIPLASSVLGTGLGLGAAGAAAYSGQDNMGVLGSGLFGLAAPYLAAKGYLNPSVRGATGFMGQGIEGALMNSPYLMGLFGRQE